MTDISPGSQTSVPAGAPAGTAGRVGRDAPGATVWLTGLPSAGKTTIANALAARLRADGRRVEVLDGDELRAALSPNLGFTREDRDGHVRRVGYLAQMLTRHGVVAVVPVIAPYTESRAAIRARHDDEGLAYVEVHIATALDVCQERDVKGLYARARAGDLAGMTGVDDPYEVPENPDLRLDTDGRTVEQSADAVFAVLAEQGLA